MGAKNGDPNAKRRKMREPRVVLPSSAARDSPADAAVRTILFSLIFEFLNRDKTPIEITAAGMEADTVIPAKRPR